MNDWNQQYLGQFPKPTEKELLLEYLAAKYHELCDAYDAKICTTISERTGEAIPATSEEARLINKNAFEVIELLQKEGIAFLITKKELMNAIRDHLRRNK